MLFDDTHNQPSSLQEANTVDNYILLLKKKDIQPELVHLQLSHGEDDHILSSSSALDLPTLCQFNSKKTDSSKECELNLGIDIIHHPSMEKNGNKIAQFVFIDDEDIVNIEDHNEEECTGLDDPSEILPVLRQTNYESNELENEKHILDKKCRGCGKIMERLVKHLRRKKWKLCMTQYQPEEIKMHSLALTSIQKSNYREKNKEKIKEKRNEY
jgi:hypothetical protein